MIGIAELAGRRDERQAAARLVGAADRISQDMGLRLQPYLSDRFDRARQEAKTALGDASFATAWASGRALTMAQAVDEAILASEPPIATAAPLNDAAATGTVSTSTDTGLTPREREVLRLLSLGRSSRAIADELFISHRTATTHVANILAKLEVNTRAAAVSVAIRRGLV